MKSLKKEFIMFVFSEICIDSVLRRDKKNYSQVYLEQCKYKIKKRELVRFINDEVDLSSDYESDVQIIIMDDYR